MVRSPERLWSKKHGSRKELLALLIVNTEGHSNTDSEHRRASFFHCPCIWHQFLEIHSPWLKLDSGQLLRARKTTLRFSDFVWREGLYLPLPLRSSSSPYETHVIGGGKLVDLRAINNNTQMTVDIVSERRQQRETKMGS